MGITSTAIVIQRQGRKFLCALDVAIGTLNVGTLVVRNQVIALSVIPSRVPQVLVAGRITILTHLSARRCRQVLSNIMVTILVFLLSTLHRRLQHPQRALERLGQMQPAITLAWIGSVMVLRALIATIGTVQELELELPASINVLMAKSGPAVWGIITAVSNHARHG